MKKLTLVLGILLCSTITWAQGIAGTWNGELNLGTVKLPLVFHIGDNDCTLDSPNQGAKGIKGTVKHLSADSINVDFETLGGSYVAKLVNGKLNGIFSQMGYKLKLELDKGDLVRLRPQTPQAPYPYQTEEVVFTNVKDTASLAGTLTYPVGYRAGKKVPVVLMITGSGMQNRDEELFEHKPFAVIADYLARHGIASLRYDDRQVGGSTGNISHATSED
ncbi:MAG: alpha/beta hydrolase, partial [Prevotella sp.]|nr:alpha/beta hydrolase [Prevotella sp.]